MLSLWPERRRYKRACAEPARMIDGSTSQMNRELPFPPAPAWELGLTFACCFGKGNSLRLPKRPVPLLKCHAPEITQVHVHSAEHGPNDLARLPVKLSKGFYLAVGKLSAYLCSSFPLIGFHCATVKPCWKMTQGEKFVNSHSSRSGLYK